MSTQPVFVHETFLPPLNSPPTPVSEAWRLMRHWRLPELLHSVNETRRSPPHRYAFCLMSLTAIFADPLDRAPYSLNRTPCQAPNLCQSVLPARSSQWPLTCNGLGRYLADLYCSLLPDCTGCRHRMHNSELKEDSDISLSQLHWMYSIISECILAPGHCVC